MNRACLSARAFGSSQEPRRRVVSHRDAIAICYDHCGCRDFDLSEASTRTMADASTWLPTPRSGGSAAATCESFPHGVSRRSAPRANERDRVLDPLARGGRRECRSERKGRVR